MVAVPTSTAPTNPSAGSLSNPTVLNNCRVTDLLASDVSSLSCTFGYVAVGPAVSSPTSEARTEGMVTGTPAGGFEETSEFGYVAVGLEIKCSTSGARVGAMETGNPAGGFEATSEHKRSTENAPRDLSKW